MLINLAAAGVSPGFPGRQGDVQVLFHAELGKNAFILWHVADTNGAARLSGQGGEILRRGANVMPGHPAASHRQVASNAVNQGGFSHALASQYANALSWA